MRHILVFMCTLIGLSGLVSTAAGQNDSIWITDAGGITLSVGHRAHDTTLVNGWIYKVGDHTNVCPGNSVQLNIHASYALIHHILWVPNVGSLPNPNAPSITVSPTVNTDYSGYVYEDVGGVSTYRGMVKISVIIAAEPQTFHWILDGVMDGDTAHTCIGTPEVMQYSGSQLGNTYQLYDWFTNLPVGGSITGDGNPINLSAVGPGKYYLFIDNGVCAVFDF